MKYRPSRTAAMAGAFCLALPLTAAIAQPRQATLYALHSSSTGACPGFDWHVTWEPDNALIGFVAWDRMQHMARLTGTIKPDGQFSMNAQEVTGGHRTAAVSGTASGDYVKIAINGSGTPCDGQELNIPRATGNMGGGGG